MLLERLDTYWILNKYKIFSRARKRYVHTKQITKIDNKNKDDVPQMPWTIINMKIVANIIQSF